MYKKLSRIQQAAEKAFVHLTTMRIAMASGAGLAVMLPQVADADGLGTTMKNASTEVSTGASVAMQYGFAAIGFGMVGYSVYGMTIGRKKDERDWPVGQTLGIGFGGVVLLGILAYAGILSTSFFGTDNSSDGTALILGN